MNTAAYISFIEKEGTRVVSLLLMVLSAALSHFGFNEKLFHACMSRSAYVLLRSWLGIHFRRASKAVRRLCHRVGEVHLMEMS